MLANGREHATRPASDTLVNMTGKIVVHVTVVSTFFFALASGCQSSLAPVVQTDLANAGSPGVAELGAGVYWSPSTTTGKRWVVLLPGSSGLSIFGDDGHYFRAASQLNQRGFDALIIDYKVAYKAASERPDVSTGEKIAWVTERSIALARAGGQIRGGTPGALVAWSLGAESLWVLLPDEVRLSSLGVRAAIAYYPANETGAKIKTPVPLLLLIGGADDVTPKADLLRSLPDPVSPLIQVRSFEGAQHGFDITSLRQPKTVRPLLFIGPKATFAYNENAAKAASAALGAFLEEHVR